MWKSFVSKKYRIKIRASGLVLQIFEDANAKPEPHPQTNQRINSLKKKSIILYMKSLITYKQVRITVQYGVTLKIFQIWGVG
jgi:hypothetical protein